MKTMTGSTYDCGTCNRKILMALYKDRNLNFDAHLNPICDRCNELDPEEKKWVDRVHELIAVAKTCKAYIESDDTLIRHELFRQMVLGMRSLERSR